MSARKGDPRDGTAARETMTGIDPNPSGVGYDCHIHVADGHDDGYGLEMRSPDGRDSSDDDNLRHFPHRFRSCQNCAKQTGEHKLIIHSIF